MNRSRWACLIAVAVYVVAFMGVPLLTNDAWDKGLNASEFFSQFVVGSLVVLGFVCVWWAEVLGDALWPGQGGWNPMPSTAGGMMVLGWLFLILASVSHAAAPFLLAKFSSSGSGSQLRKPFMEWLERR